MISLVDIYRQEVHAFPLTTTKTYLGTEIARSVTLMTWSGSLQQTAEQVLYW